MVDTNTYFTKRKTTKLDKRFPSIKHIKKEKITAIKIDEVKPVADKEVAISVVKDKKVTGIISVKSAPSEVEIGSIINPGDVLINANYSDGTSNKVLATMVLCDTSVKGKVVAKAYYNEFGPVLFAVTVK